MVNRISQIVLLLFFILTTFYLLPNTVFAATREENAIYNQNTTQLPKEVITSNKIGQPDLLSQIKNLASQLIGQLFGRVESTEKFYPQSENVAKSQLPEDTLPKETENPLESLKGFLGGSEENGCQSGFYGNELPEFEEKPTTIKDCETAYEKSILPEGVKVITP